MAEYELIDADYIFAYEQGHGAVMRGQGDQSNNPHPKDSILWKLWEEGANDATLGFNASAEDIMNFVKGQK